ncbi:MAG: hypothetical protein ACO2O1_11325 [Candidatus Caldarchaeales archaeon]|jgi:hypothetical protein
MSEDPKAILYELESGLKEIVSKLDLPIETQRDYLGLLRRIVRAGVQISSLEPEYVETVVANHLEASFNIVKSGALRTYEVLYVYLTNHLLLRMLGLVYLFFGDWRSEEFSELLAEYEKLIPELADRAEKDPHAPLSPELANRVHTAFRDVLSVIKKRVSDEEAAEPHG